MTMPPFSIKRSLSIEEQIDYLISKNVVIKSKDQAKQILGRVSYYRLKGYMLPFKDLTTGQYEPVRFSTLLSLLRFDQEIRSLIMKYTEHIEITLRTFIVRTLCSDSSSTGFEYEDINHFKNKQAHDDVLHNIYKEINRSDELYIEHYKKYHNGKFPLWVCIHVLSFGTLYNFFRSLKPYHQRKIALLYGKNIHDKELKSSLNAFTYLRNKCAHFSRIYYTPFIKHPMAKIWYKKYDIPFDNKMLFVQILIMKNLCVDAQIWNIFFKDLCLIIDRYSKEINLEHIGFPENWRNILK